MVVGTAVEFDPKTVGEIGAPDGAGGTLSNPARSKYIFLGCALNKSGTPSSQALPPGLTLNQATCLITGTPSSPFTDTTFGNMGGLVTYNVDLYYKGSSYAGAGTEVKITTQFKLMSHDKPILDPATWIAPTSFTFALSGTTTSLTAANFEIGIAKTFVPIVNGSLSNASIFSYSFTDCSIDIASPTTVLPAGISLDSTKCKIGGTASGIPAVNPAVYTINMKYKGPTYNGPGTEQTIQATFTIGTYYKPSGLTYNQTDKLLFSLTSVAGLVSNLETNSYDSTGLLTTASGVTGVIKYIDTTGLTAGVVRVIPLTLASSAGFVKNDFIYGAGGAIGKIENVVGNVVSIERLTPTLNFAAAESVQHKALYPSVYAAADTTISSIDTNNAFDVGINTLDNNTQFYSAKYQATTITRIYEKGVSIDPITPITSSIISTLNGITFTVAPALPTGLTLNSTTGIISGSFTDVLPSTKFIITAANPLGSTTFTMYLSAIEGPKDLSYTRNQLITVTSNSAFNEGKYLFQPITPPLTTSVSGQVLRKYGTTQMSIATSSGQFLPGASIDSGNAYYSEKTVISSTVDPIYYNVALTVANTALFTASTTTTSYYASSSSGSLGRVVAIDAGSNTLFIQYLNTSVTPTRFQEGNTICSGATYASCSGSAVAINQVESANMYLTISAIPATLKAGDELSAAPAFALNGGDLSGYIHKISGSNIYVSDVSRRSTQANYFRIGQHFDDNEQMLVDEGTFTAVANDVLFIAERGSKIEIKSNVSSGSGINYTVTPTLPIGLTLNSQTGLITGAATYATARATYTISAKNLVNESKYVFDLEARDFLSVAENSGASSFIFHKYGDGRGSRKCRINSTDIKTFGSSGLTGVNSGALDVRCFLDAEEADLHLTKLKMLSSVGAGTCEYVQIYPYSFWQYSPQQRANPGTYAYNTGCTPDASMPLADRTRSTTPGTAEYICSADPLFNGSNYTSSGGPNCDEGSVSVTLHSWVVNSGTGKCTDDTATTTTVACGGKKTNCLRGPVRDILTDNEIQGGSRSLIYPAAVGGTIASTFSAPGDTLDKSNIRAANGSINNLCTTTNTDADLLAAYHVALPDTDNPLAGGVNPYYIVNCLDAAKDIKARIRIVVRDWNKSFKIKDAIDYDLPGGAGATTLMNNTTIVFGKNNNDYNDWDDAYNGVAANPKTNATAKTCSTLGVGGEWGACSDGIQTTQAACLAVPATWTSYKYKYPAGNL